MSDLRSRCLTAMVEAMVDEAPAMFDDYAAACLDALLGVLEAHSYEWTAASWEYPALRSGLRFVEALKPSTAGCVCYTVREPQCPAHDKPTIEEDRE